MQLLQVRGIKAERHGRVWNAHFDEGGGDALFCPINFNRHADDSTGA